MQCRDCNGTGVYIPRSLRVEPSQQATAGDLAGAEVKEAPITVIQNLNREIDHKLDQITELRNKRDLATNLGVAHMPVDVMHGLVFPSSPF